MRRFLDSSGSAWEAVVGRESWGAFFAIFVPATGPEAVRQTLLEADSWSDAERMLEALDQPALQRLLGSATIKSLD